MRSSGMQIEETLHSSLTPYQNVSTILHIIQVAIKWKWKNKCVSKNQTMNNIS